MAVPDQPRAPARQAGRNEGAAAHDHGREERRLGAPPPSPISKPTARYVVIGSFLGEPRHPAWVHNLRANPRAAVQVGSLADRGLRARGGRRGAFAAVAAARGAPARLSRIRESHRSRDPRRGALAFVGRDALVALAGRIVSLGSSTGLPWPGGCFARFVNRVALAGRMFCRSGVGSEGPLTDGTSNSFCRA